MTKKVRNAAKCVRCGVVIESKYGHDFKVHSCHPDIWFMVDGGPDPYGQRRGWKEGTSPGDNFTNVIGDEEWEWV